MATWLGPAPVGQQTTPFSIRSWGDDRSAGWTNPDGTELNWWEGPNIGVQFQPQACTGAVCEPVIEACETCDGLSCDDCAPDDECYADEPGWVDLKPFWIKAGFNACPAHQKDPDRTYAALLRNLNATQYSQVARRYHQILQAVATDVTGATASTLTEGIGTLLRNRGTIGLNWGGLVVPGYALPALTSAGLVSTVNGSLLGPGGIPVWTDPGLPVTGPGGRPPGDPGIAFIYVAAAPPVFAIRDETLPGGENWTWDNPQSRRKFYSDDCGGCGDCFRPFARRRAVVVTDTCGVFGIAVDVRDCSCPDALTPGDVPVEAEVTAKGEG